LRELYEFGRGNVVDIQILLRRVAVRNEGFIHEDAIHGVLRGGVIHVMAG